MTIQAYARDLSVRAGETLQLCVSTDAPRFRVRFSRQGQQLAHIPSMDTSVLTGYNVPSGPPSDDWGWPAYDILIPEDLPSGPYIAMLTEIDADGNESEPAGDPLTRLEGNALVVVRPAVGGPRRESSTRFLPQRTTRTTKRAARASIAALVGGVARTEVGLRSP